jgi:virginiamycin A acetyltransferase
MIQHTSLKENVYIDRDSIVINSKIDRYSTIGKNSHVINAKIGKFVSISWNVTVGAIQHKIKNLTTHAFPYSSAFNIVDNNKFENIRTIIGHDVWIGTGAIIMSGVNIGNGSIIGAGSIVTKDIEPYSVVAGNPTKLLYKRFSQEIIVEIEKIKWWNWDKEKIQNYIQYFKQPLTMDIINKIKNKDL